MVIGDDAVAAGMLALDLVQAGFDAHGAADVWSASEQLRAASRTPVLVTGFSHLQRTLEVWRHIRGEGLAVHVVAVVDPQEHDAAQAAAMAGDWLGVLPRPLRMDALVDLLDRHGRGAAQDAQEVGQLHTLGVAAVLERELIAARRDPARRNFVLHVESRERRGEVAVIDGELVHAQVEVDQGRHALERMFCWRRGSWRLQHGLHAGPATLTGAWRGVMSAAHEYARRVEEARRSMPLRDHVVTVRWERVRPLPVVAEALFRRLARGVTVGEALDGEGDDELEAFAALLTRIRRGAVEPLEQTVADQPSRFPTHTHQRPGLGRSAGPTDGATLRGPAVPRSGGFAGAAPAPDRGAAGAQGDGRRPHRDPSGVMAGVRPSASQAMRTSTSHRRPNAGEGRRGSRGFTQPVDPRAVSGAVSAPQRAGEQGLGPDAAPAGDRHSDTSSYQPIPLLPRRHAASEPLRFGGEAPEDLPEIPVASARENTPTHAPVLPASLPDVESDAWDASPAEAPADTGPVLKATGWFGLNVGKGEDEVLGANVDAMRDALVQGGRVDPEEALAARMSQSVAEIPRVHHISDGLPAEDVDAHYSMFATDNELDAAHEASIERSQLELLAPPGKAGLRARLFWIAALLVVGTVLTLVVWPSSPLYDRPGDATAVTAEQRTYRRAVDLIDAGQEAEAASLLRLVHSRVSPEATLQLAVLEVKARRFRDARALLQTYLRAPKAKHAKDAKRLYDHVFGEAP